jgi:hypothetical protein
MTVGSTNPGPAVESTVNTQSPRGFFQFIQTIAVSLTPVALAANVSAEQSFGANGVTQATAATGILAGDVILSISPPSTVADVVIGGYRVDTATADKFYINFGNVSATTPTPPSGLYLITVGRLIQSVTTTPGTLSSLPSSIVTTS